MTAIATQEPRADVALAAPLSLAARWGMTEQMLAVVRSQIAVDAPDDVLELFFARCKHYGADPLAKMIYVIPRDSNKKDRAGNWITTTTWTMQASIDFFRSQADQSGEYAGQLGPFWCGPDGAWKDVWLEKRPPAAAKVGVKKRGFDEPLWAVARWDSYAQVSKQSGEPTGLWKTMGDVMIAKCSEALALRKAFPSKLQGLYTGDEMAQADNGKDDAPKAARGKAKADDPTVALPAPSTPAAPALTIPMLTAEYAKLVALNDSFPAKLSGWLTANEADWMDDGALSLGKRPSPPTLTQSEMERVKKMIDEGVAFMSAAQATDVPADAQDAVFTDTPETVAESAQERVSDAPVAVEPQAVVDAPPATVNRFGDTEPTQQFQRIKISRLCKALGLDDIAYRKVLKEQTGKSSTTTMTANEAQKVLDHLAGVAVMNGVEVPE